jgi:hypothetical protein
LKIPANTISSPFVVLLCSIVQAAIYSHCFGDTDDMPEHDRLMMDLEDKSPPPKIWLTKDFSEDDIDEFRRHKLGAIWPYHVMFVLEAVRLANMGKAPTR